MQTYLSIIENNLCSAVFYAAAGIIIASVMLCILIRSRYRSKVVSLGAALEKEQTANEQERIQLSDNLRLADEKTKQLEEELNNKNARIEQIENAIPAFQAQAEQATILEEEIKQRNDYLVELLDTFEKEFGLDANDLAVFDSLQEETLWQRHSAVIGALINRLHAEEQSRAELEQTQRTWQMQLIEKESEAQGLNKTIEDQRAHIAQIEQHLAQQQAMIQEQQNTEATLQDLRKTLDGQHAYIAQIEQNFAEQQNNEAALQDLRNTVEEQCAHIAQIEQSLAEQQEIMQEQQAAAEENILKLQTKIRAYKAYIGKLELGRMKVFNDLNLAAQKIHQLEIALENVPPVVEPAASVEPLVEEAAVQQQEEAPEPLQPDIETAEEMKQSKPLLARIMDSVKADLSQDQQAAEKEEEPASEQQVAVEHPREEKPPVSQIDLNLLAEKEASIARLQKELEAQQNHISRLEYDLEVKNLLIQDSRHEVRAIPAAVVQKQAEDQARIAELEAKLSGSESTAVQKSIEKISHFPQDMKHQWLDPVTKQLHDLSENVQQIPQHAIENISQLWVNPAKEKIDEATEIAKHIPEQLKGLYQKMTPFKHKEPEKPE